MGQLAAHSTGHATSKRPNRLRRVNLGKWLAFAYFGLFVLFLFLPIVTVVIFSFGESKLLIWPPTSFTTHWYSDALSDETMREAIRNSVVVAIGTVLISVPLGLAGAYLITRTRVRGKAIFTAVLMTPLVIPAVIVGIALLSFYRFLGVQTGLQTVLLAHVVLAIPYTSLVLAAQLQGFDRSLEEAAQNLGASPLTTFRKVTLPLLRPGLVAAAVFAFLTSFDEFLITFFVIGTKELTLPIKIYSTFRFGMTPAIHAVATLMTVVSLVLLTIAFVRSRIYRFD